MFFLQLGLDLLRRIVIGRIVEALGTLQALSSRTESANDSVDVKITDRRSRPRLGSEKNKQDIDI